MGPSLGGGGRLGSGSFLLPSSLCRQQASLDLQSGHGEYMQVGCSLIKSGKHAKQHKPCLKKLGHSAVTAYSQQG